MTLWGRLPLDHDGLIGAATRDDCLRGGTRRLFGESQPGGAEKGKEEVIEETKSEAMH